MTPMDAEMLDRALCELCECTPEDRAVAFTTLRNMTKSGTTGAHVMVGYLLCAVMLSCVESPNYVQAKAVLTGLNEQVGSTDLENVATELVQLAALGRSRALHAVARLVYVTAHEDQRG